MSLLSQLHVGKRPAPRRCMIHGVQGVGKSTFGATARKPVFVQTEDGLGEIDCAKFPLARSFVEVMDALTELRGQPHEFETVVLDSLDWLERLIWDDVCRKYGVTTIEKADGGYGKGYIHALSWWRQVIDRLMTLRNDRGMAVLLIAHAKIEKFEDPEATAYDRYSPRLNKHAAALLCEWCDAVLFATLKIVTKTEDAGFNRKRTTAAALGAPGSGGERILRAVGGPACVAKNRYGIKADLPLSWAEFMAALETHHTTSQGEQTHGNA